jgi:hypothetical protein
MPATTSRAAILAIVAVAACSAYWWAQSSREVKPGATVPPASSAARPLEPLKSAPLKQRVAHEVSRAEPPAQTAHREGEAPPAMEQEIDAEQVEAEERARMQAVQLELGSVLSKEAVDRDFSGQAQADIDAAIGNLGSGVRLMSTDCRTTLCRLEVWSTDLAAMGEFLDSFPAALGWSTDMRMETQEDAGGGVVTTLFMTRNGVAMPTLAAEQR